MDTYLIVTSFSYANYINNEEISFILLFIFFCLLELKFIIMFQNISFIHFLKNFYNRIITIPI